MLATGKTTFVKHDYNILSSIFITEIVYMNSVYNIITSIPKVFNTDKIFCRFGAPQYALNVLLGRLLGKKVITVVGGYDVAKNKKYKYGVYTHPIKSILGRVVLELSNIICPIDEGLIKDLNKRGIHNKNIKVIPIMIDVKIFKLCEEKKDLIVMVASTNKKPNYFIKGIDYFISLAEAMPKHKFLLIGTKLCFVPKNLTSVGNINFSYLINILKTSKYYVHLSRREGCPHSLAEAVACGCISFGWNVQGTQSILKQKYLVKKGDVRTLRELILKTKKFDKEQRKKVIKKYSRKNREKLLVGVINDI